MLDQIVSLIEKGHQVRIIADSTSGEQSEHEEIASFDLPRRTRYLHEQTHTRRQRLVTLARALRLGRHKLVKALISFRLARRRTGETGGLAALAATTLALAEAPPPHVVLCHFGPNGSLAVRAIEALGWTVPVVTMFHGYDLSRLIKQKGPRLYDHLFHHGRLFMPACEAFAERLQVLNCPTNRIVVQRMCVNLSKLDTAINSLEDKIYYSEVFTFVTIGRLVPKKGVANTITAFAEAFGHLSTDEVRLRIVGDGPMRDELETLAQKIGIANKVEFLGSLIRSDVLSVVKASDVVVQASTEAPDGDVEASPLVISEAMALRKPVIGTHHSGIPELITDGTTGILVEEDGEGLASAMSWMMANRSAAARMGDAGRHRLETGLSAEVWNARLEKRLLALASSSTDRH